MLSLGQRFRQQREQRKVSLDAVAEQTKISTRYLHAIETENFQELPSGFFRRSFIRQYAEALGLDYHAMESEIEEMFGTPESSRIAAVEALPARAITVEPMPTQGGVYQRDHKLAWAIGLLVFAVAACSGIYALWERTQRVQAHEDVTPAPAGRTRVTESRPAPASPAAETKPAPPADNAATVPSPQSGGAPQVQSSTVSPAQSTAAAPAPFAAPQPRKINIEIAATERSWVRLTSDAKTVFAGTLEPTQTRSFEANERAKVLVGNAGGIDVRWNGKSIGTAGPRGQIRTLEFTPETYLILSPPPPE
jgi:cytoskeleton protein RodZ